MILARSILYAAAFYVVTALFLLLGSWLLVSPRPWAMEGLRLHGLTCRWLLKVICGTRFELRGGERIPRDGCLVVSKHQSAWDTFALVPLFRDPAIVLKDELKWIPFYGWFCVKFAHILVKRERAAAALKSMIRDARQRVAAGRQVVIFPEGTRRPPGAPPDYKPGFVALYEGLGVPCIPLALNSGLYWPRRSILRYPGTIIVEALEPIPPGLPRAQFKRTLETRLEEVSVRLISEAAGSRCPPPTAAEAISRAAGINQEHN